MNGEKPEIHDELTQAILESAYDAIILIDDRGTVQRWNRRAEEIFGWARDEILGRSLSDFIIPERYRSRHRTGIQNYLATGQGPILGTVVETEARHKDGEEFPVELTVSAVPWRDQTLFVGILRDVSERKAIEARLQEYARQLEESNRSKDKLIAQLQDLKRELEESSRTDTLTGLSNRREMLEILNY